VHEEEEEKRPTEFQGSDSTVTGAERLVVVPSPSWPWLLRPQHLAVPSESRAQVWLYPAWTAVTTEGTVFVAAELAVALPPLLLTVTVTIIRLLASEVTSW